MKWETDYKNILEKIDQIDPIRYGQNRNYENGAVTYLSPYISRGVISTRQVLQKLLEKGYKIQEILAFAKELCWRDYFQRVGQVRNLNRDIQHQQPTVLNHAIPSNVLNASTGIEGVDRAIQRLYSTGYMHNHCRMYTASLVCNIAKSHWLHPAQWMYYHLLDGDWASNACSWQWVAGANSNKKYYANQENINKYTFTNQVNTYLDISYEALETMEVPAQLSLSQHFIPTLDLPASSMIKIDSRSPVYFYNYYNLDPEWHKDEKGNRILLIEPAFFSSNPISKKCVDFMLDLSKNIPDLQVYAGSFESISREFNSDKIYYKEHPLNAGYTGSEEPRDWIANAVTGYFPSFFSYWKQVEKYLVKEIQ